MKVLTSAPFPAFQDYEGPPAAGQKFCLRTSEPRAIFKFEIFSSETHPQKSELGNGPGQERRVQKNGGQASGPQIFLIIRIRSGTASNPVRASTETGYTRGRKHALGARTSPPQQRDGAYTAPAAAWNVSSALAVISPFFQLAVVEEELPIPNLVFFLIPVTWRCNNCPGHEIKLDRMDIGVIRPTSRSHACSTIRIEAVVHHDIQ